MRLRHKKLLISGTAVTVAGVLVAGTLLQTSVSVQASAQMMPGIEEIIKNTSSDTTPFKILEIVDDASQAEIGYYIAGQEPYIKLYKDKDGNPLSFSSLEDGLSKLTDVQTRKEFAENKKTDENGNAIDTGIKDIFYAATENGPLSFSEYRERYFTNPDNWEEVKFKNADGSSRTEKVEVQGSYQQNPNGTGDYTKQEQTYYPVRQGTEDNTNNAEKFRENIQNFFYSEGDGANAPYYLEFDEVSNGSVNQMLGTTDGQSELLKEYDYSNNRYGYYENVYSNLTTDLAENLQSFPGEKPEKPEGLDPLLTIAPLKVEDQFSEGENEFGTGGIVVQDNIDSGNSSGSTDSFSSDRNTDAAYASGDEFSDSQQISDSTGDATVTEAPDEQPTADQNSEDITDASADDGIKGDAPATLKETSKDGAVGTAANPYVYLGTTIEQYPYYSYAIITDLKAAKEEAEANAQEKQKADEKGETYVPQNKAITVEDGQYYYWQQSGNDMVKSPITIITGKQPVSYSDVIKNEISEKLPYNYYYRVSSVYFCCRAKADNSDTSDPENYEYYGWYYSTHPQGEDIYLPVTDAKNATYYISDAEYKFTPGTGDYDFVPGTGEGTKTYKVETDHMYYSGGYKNNDWFKKYVFHLDPDNKETKDDFKNFNIEVTTLTTAEFTELYGNETADSETDNEANAQFSDGELSDDSEEISSEENQEITDESISATDDSAETDGGEVTEVAPVISEAGVDLVSIEKEISDGNTTETDSEEESEKSTAMESAEESVEDQNEENGEAENETTADSESQSAEFQDGNADNDAQNTSDITSPESEFTDDTEAFSAGDTQGTTSENNALSGYDLLYLNGTLETNAAEAIVSSDVPCIVNSDKAATDAEFLQKYAGFVKNGVGDHYVNDYIYFFKNTFEEEHTGDLINLHFDDNLNSDSEITDDSGELTGFDEILEYIESENQYRKIGNTGISDGTEVELLTKEISQARAIEYIINSKHKREVTYKDNINVLEITPDKNCSQITNQDVYKWLGKTEGSSGKKNVTIKNVTACHSETEQATQVALNMLKNDDSIWHSIWQYKKGSRNENDGWDGTKEISENTYQGQNIRGHHITIQLETVSDVSGFTYTSQAGKNGVLLTGYAEFRDKNGELIQVENKDTGVEKAVEFKTGLSENDYYKKTVDVSFGQTIQNVKEITIYFTGTFAQDSGNMNKFATCAKISVFSLPKTNWAEIENITACHSHTVLNADQSVDEKNSELSGNMKDGDSSTIWHSPWQGADSWDGKNEVTNGHKGHYVTITLKDPSTINGLMYQPRQTGGSNGTLVSGVVELRDQNGKLKDTIKVSTGLSSTDYKRSVDIMFGKTVSDVKTITLYFSETLPNSAFASCAELKAFYLPDQPCVTVTSMTAAEFVGHIDDLSSEYDMIYISDGKSNSSEKLLTGSGELRYSHVGAAVAAKDGTIVTSGNRPKEIGNSELFKLLGQLNNEYDATYEGEGKYRKRFAPINTFSEHRGGYFRGSGNDITKNQCEELLNFVKSGYPVILASGLVSDNRKINVSEVDTASYYYQFMNSALNYDNVVTKEELENGKKDINFFANLAKPVIVFDEKEGKPKEPQRANVSTETDSDKYGNISGELKFVFSIENDSDAIPAVTTYDCDLYLDLNFDGNMSSKEAQDKYIEISDSDGHVLSQVDYGNGDMRYELEAGKKYTLTRKIPEDYYKIITWKLQVSSNRKSYIHTVETGYAKQARKKGTARQKIYVLQLLPDKEMHWNLGATENNEFKNKINDLKNNLDLDFDIEVETQPITDINAYSVEDTKKWVNEKLNKKQMLILGFADTYQDISNNSGQVNAILDFVRSGKSIIFAHDTTSYVNYNYDEMYPSIVSTKYGEVEDKYAQVYYDGWLHSHDNKTWGLSLNQVLRSVVGMDRYGITSDYKISSEENSKTIGDILKEGNELQKDNSSVSFEILMKVAGDIAYQTGGDRSSSYAQTQSYTNALLNQKKMGSGDTLVSYATKVNDGAITQYPYVIGDTIKIANTHGQYYQLALEQDYDTNNRSDGETDIVVWYCLGGNGGSSLYDFSPNDARNNYYLYSKGNVIYTGAGHSDVTDEKEINLFINAIVAAANVAAVAPEVSFIKSLDPAAETETTRYYMTDQKNWTSSDSNQNVINTDMDFFVNVKDYNMVSLDLTQGDLDNQDMTLDFYIQDKNGADSINIGNEEIKVTNLNDQIGSLKIYGKADKVVNRGADGSFHFTENNAYGFSLKDIERYLKDKNSGKNDYYKSCKIYVKVRSTVSLYGNTIPKESWSYIDLKQRRLFDLD